MDIANDPPPYSVTTSPPADASLASPSSATRLLSPRTRLRPRRDLQWIQAQPVFHAGRENTQWSSSVWPRTSSSNPRSLWIAFDPITRRSYRFGAEERWIIEQLDGLRSLADIQQQFADQFQPSRIEFQGLAELCRGLLKNGLVHESGVRTALRASNATRLTIADFIVWRIRGVDADPLLARLAPHASWLFSPTAVQCWLALAILTVIAVLLEFPRLASQATSWDWLIQPANWGILMVVFLITRGLHELGHALACKRSNVRCPDIGLLMILGAPCVYCDVSESWKLPNAWQRAAIAAAGMYVELIVAVGAAIVWIATVDGVANTIALQTMVVCSISTIIINANPLMRFDGYYILSDIADEPNLRSCADSSLWRLLLNLVLGSQAVRELPLATPALRRRLLIGFSLAGWMYRISLSFAMATMIVAIYDHWQIIWFGRLLAVSLLVSWWIIPMFRLTQNLWTIADRSGSKLRLSVMSALLVIAAGIMPIPQRQFSCGWVQPKQMHGVYAPSTAQLNRISTQDGQPVYSETILFELRDDQLQLIAEERAAQAQRIGLELSSRRRDRYFQNTSKVDLSVVEAAAETARHQAEHATRSVERLCIKSPIDGSFMAMPAAPLEEVVAIQTASALGSWVDAAQLGRRVLKGTMLGTVCSDHRIAVLPMTDRQLAWIHAGTEVRLRLSSSSFDVLRCKVQSIVQLQEIDSSWRLISAKNDTNELSSNSTSVGSTALQYSSPVSTGGYLAIVELPEFLHFLPGTRVDAAFIVPSNTLVQLASRWSQENLRWLAD